MKKINFKKLSQKELGYLIGLFDGDGYDYMDIKHGKYYIQFYLNSLTDEGVKNQLNSILNKIDLKPNIFKDKRFNCLKIEITQKSFYKFILNFSKNNPKNKDFKIGYLSGIIDSDGYVNRSKHYIQITNTDKNLMKRVQKYLKSLDINSKITKKAKCAKDKSQRYSLYVPIKFLYTKNNSMKVMRLR